MNLIKNVVVGIIICAAISRGVVFAASVTYKEIDIDSKILNEKRTILVSLPDGYESTLDLKYPVQYVLDGRANVLHTRATSDYISYFSEMPRTIIVGIANTNRTRDLTPSVDTSRARESGNADNFLDFIEFEVIKYIEDNYRTARFRSIAGHSLGGLAVTQAFIRRPDLYNAYFAFSPSFTWNRGEHLKHLEESLKANNGASPFFYMSMANEKRDAKPKFLATKSLFMKHANKNLKFHSEIYPEESHGTIHLRSQHEVYRKLFNGWRIDKYKVEDNVSYIEEFINAQTKRYNYDVTLSETDFYRLSNIFLSKERHTEAIKVCKIRLKYYPNSHYAYRSLADAQYAAGHVGDAIINISKAIELAKGANDKSLLSYTEKLNEYKKKP